MPVFYLPEISRSMLDRGVNGPGPVFRGVAILGKFKTTENQRLDYFPVIIDAV
jgi:hypothetical protein